MIPRHVETLYCDDVRHEVAGKVSFIGVYSGNLLVPKFPITLPKLCVSVKIVSPANELTRSLNIRVSKDDAPLQEISVSAEQISNASDFMDDMTDVQLREHVRIAQFLLVFTPMRFEKACLLRVRVQTEGDELRGPALKVEQRSQTDGGDSED